MGPNSPDSVAILVKNFGKKFSGNLYDLKKIQPKKGISDQNRMNSTKKDKNGKQAEEILIYLYLNKLYIRLCFTLPKTVQLIAILS